MFTYFFLEIMSKDRLREEYKEAMKRHALREAFGDQRNQNLLIQKQWRRLKCFVGRIWLPKDIWLKDLEVPLEIDPCHGLAS